MAKESDRPKNEADWWDPYDDDSMASDSEEKDSSLPAIVDAVFRPNPLVAYLKRKYG